jgi:hypothetical protein
VLAPARRPSRGGVIRLASFHIRFLFASRVMLISMPLIFASMVRNSAAFTVPRVPKPCAISNYVHGRGFCTPAEPSMIGNESFESSTSRWERMAPARHCVWPGAGLLLPNAAADRRLIGC